MLYLDYQATTPLAPEVKTAMLPWLAAPGEGDGFANPASAYRAGRAASVMVEQARDAVAALLPRGGQVVFTSGATEALNWAMARAKGPKAALAIEHAATRASMELVGGTDLPVGADGVAPPPDPALLPEAGLVAVMLVNNEVGTIQPVADYADAAHARGSLLLCDAVQALGRVPIPNNVDLVALSAHKVHGPKGIGALWIRDGVELAPLIVGGSQEHGLRAGTVSPALIAGFGAAATLCAERWDTDHAHVSRLWEIAAERIAGWQILGSTTHRYRGNLSLRKDGVNGSRLLSDAREVAFSLGSACASGSGKASHVLRAMGFSPEEARGAIRIGWGRYTSEAELHAGIDALLAAATVQERFAA